jgi:DNA-binding response OmpR family regulator
MRILVVAREGADSQGLAKLLTEASHFVETVGNDQAEKRASDPAIELVLLRADRAGSADGVASLCERLRRARPALPILVVTEADDVAQRVEALDAGADDCLASPFAATQMVSRVRALGRRARLVPPDAEVIVGNDCVMNLTDGTATRDRVRVQSLSPREVGIIRWLYRHRDRPVSRDELLEQIWGLPPGLQTRTVDVTISNLRRKIESQPEHPALIVSVKGVGYRWGPSEA